MNKGLKYQEAINELKRLRAIDKNKYVKYRGEVAKQFKVSTRTIQRDMKKEKQVRKTRADAGKYKTEITHDEELMVTELMKAGKSKQEAVKIVSEKKNKKISVRLSNRIEPKETASTGSGRSTMFGEEAKNFFEKIFELDMIAPDSGIKSKFKNVSFTVDKEHLSDIILSLVDCYNMNASPGEKLQLDRKQYLRSQIFNLLSYQVSNNKVSCNLLDLNRITMMYQRMEIDYGEISPDLKVVINVCRALKPDITEDEIFALIKKYGEK